MLTGRRSGDLSSHKPRGGRRARQKERPRYSETRALRPGGSGSSSRRLRSIETGSKSRDCERIRDTPGFADRSFDVSLDRAPEILVCDGALNQVVELTARERKLLRGGDPGTRSRRKGSKELHQSLFVECRHMSHRSPDGLEGSDLPSS